MRGIATPQNLISKRAQKESQKRLTIVSPLEDIESKKRNQSSLSRYRVNRGNSRLGENRLNSQASRIEERISRLNNPKHEKHKQEMFFFESQNENKIINVKIGVGNNKNNQNSKALRIDQQTLDKYLKRKNYGSKWYIKPKKWEQVMTKGNKKEKKLILKSKWSNLNDPSIASNIETHQSRISMIESQPNVDEMKLTYNPYSKMIQEMKKKEMNTTAKQSTKTITSQNTQKDLVDEFEQNLIDAVAKKEDGSNAF